MGISQTLQSIFENKIELKGNIVENNNNSNFEHNQDQTREIFSDKWENFDSIKESGIVHEFQFEWFKQLYGFESDEDFKLFLKDKNLILDAGAGLGFKAAWLAKLAPHAIVIGVEISDSVYIASRNYKDIPNLYFLKGDIASTGILPNVIDFVVCDQVIMHTEVPEVTFQHLSDITKEKGEFACYVYSKKALPREFVDDYFRKETHSISNEDMWKLSEQLTELGKRLSDLKIEFDSPDIPLLGIKGGKYDIQRFIYWNFLKCFWRDDWGFELSKSTNYDWYAPSNAKRFSEEEFRKMISDNNLTINFFHKEEACYSGRFTK
jgi:SAM-dependent methyltransferase